MQEKGTQSTQFSSQNAKITFVLLRCHRSKAHDNKEVIRENSKPRCES